MRYFTISTGLRGAYTADNAYVVEVDSRRSLKGVIRWEADSYADAGFVGGSKRAVGWLAAEAWRTLHRPSPAHQSLCLPLARERGADYAFGIFVSPATKADYEEQDQ